MKSNVHLIILYILIFILIICQFIRVEPTIVWGSDTFVGVCVALMAITMAIIIGYQAISANEIKNELKDSKNKFETLSTEFSELKKSIEKECSDLRSKTDSDVNDLRNHADKILVSSQESIAILNALILEAKDNNKEINAFDAFEKMHEALFFGLGYESKNIEYIFAKLRQYGSNITSLTFGGSFSFNRDGAYLCSGEYSGKSLRSVLDDKYLTYINEVEKKIRGHENFSSISHDYKVLMKQFHNRLDIITKRNFPKDIKESEDNMF